MFIGMTRRSFLKQTSVAVAGISALSSRSSAGAAKGPNEKVLIGIIGCNGRGMAHIAGFLAEPNAEIAYICDVDRRAVERGIAAVARKQQRKPKGIKDLREMLDDKNLDAVSIAAPDHC